MPRLIGVCLITLGVAIALLIPLFTAVYPSFGITRETANRPEIVLPIFARTPALPVGLGLVMLVAHAAGALAMIGLWMHLGPRSLVLGAATFAGLLWMAADIIGSGIAVREMPRLASAFGAGDASAGASFMSLNSLMDALRLSAHFAGGLWVVGLCVFGLQSGSLPAWLCWVGLPVGVLLSANLIAAPLMFASMLTLPPWLIALGIVMVKQAPLVDLVVAHRAAAA
jgi:hypothetical protein